MLLALFCGMELHVVLKECQSQRKCDELLTDVIPFLKRKEELKLCCNCYINFYSSNINLLKPSGYFTYHKVP